MILPGLVHSRDHAQSPTNRSGRRKITKKVRAFIHWFAESGFIDIEGAGKAAGFKQSRTSWEIYERFRDLIDRERLRRTMGHEMGLDEALKELAGVARQHDDIKTKHAALRTILEIHGALGKDVDPRDRKKLVREAEALLAEMRSMVGAKPTPELTDAPAAVPAAVPANGPVIDIRPQDVVENAVLGVSGPSEPTPSK